MVGKHKIVSTAVDCMNLLNPRDGSVSLTGTIFTSVATYSCNDGFSLNGRVTRMCQADGTWSEDAPTCERESNNRHVHVC